MDMVSQELQDLGLSLTLDFLTITEEKLLLEKINNIQRRRSVSGSARTSVSRFGSDQYYGSHMQSKIIPDYLMECAERLLAQGLVSVLPDSISINEYSQSQVIPPHIDNLSAGTVITVLSLESPATMRFTLEKRGLNIILPPRSVVQIRGEIRNTWKHEILPVPAHRFSVVFRGSVAP
jgi:alkylated DNA repair dioxygenase AlkB